jgi:hypothetical protein
MKRGQAAMEFLMTYGWAIMVVLIAIGALAYFGVLNPSKFLPESCTLFPGVSCDDFKVSENGRVEINILNGKGQNLENVVVKLSNSETEEIECVLVCTEGCEGPTTLLDGSLSIWSLDGCIEELPEGQRYKGDIVFEYSLTTGGVLHTIQGQLVTIVESSEAGGEEEPGSPWSYQENSNSASCTTYFEGHEEYCNNMTDGNWDTYISLSIMDPDAFPPGPLVTTMNLYVNYTKPAEVLSSSRWEIKSGSHLTHGNPAHFNLTFTGFADCWSQEPLMLKSFVYHWYGHGGETTYFYCHDGVDWVHMNEEWGPLSSDATFYEEGMWWESPA